MSEKIDQIVEELKTLTLLEASELVTKIEETFDVDASAAAGGGVVMAAAPAAEEEVEEKTEFNLMLDEVPADKTGVVHVNFGKIDFTTTQLTENLTALYRSIEQNRPSGVKGKYFKSAFICTTMGSSIKLDLDLFA